MADEINTIPEILRYWSENNGDSKVFSFYDRNGLVTCLTCQDVYTLSGKFSSCLRDWGFQQGDVIANGLPNSPERIITDFGIIMAGCVASNCQVIEKDGSDFWNTARMSKCRAIITCPRQDNPSYKLLFPFLPDNTNNSGIYNISLNQVPSIQKIIVCDRQQGAAQNSLLENLKQCNNEIFEAVCSPSSLAALFGTSGSSGFSKLIPESHEIILRSGRMFRAAENSLYYTDRPMGWIGGFPFEFLCFGARRVGQDKFVNQHTESPHGLWNIISTAGCTGAALLPSTVCELVDYFQNKTPDYKLQFITSSGQPMKRESMAAIGLLCHAIIVSYGATEGGMFAFDTITDPSQFKDFYCGKVMKDVQVKMVGDDGNEVDNGEEGEIYLKSDRLVKNYYNQSADSSNLTNSYTTDGWFKLGDRGILHSDGSLFCFGRKGDVVSIGPTIVYLSWPENVLNKCPDIQNSSIVGIEEETGNVELCACVVPKPEHASLTESRVSEFFDGAMMDTGYKFKLKLSHVFVMEKLPHLPSGKVHKRELNRFVAEKLKSKQ